jgi:hypothetical protein
MSFGLARQFDVRSLPSLKCIINIISILALISLLVLPIASALTRCYTGCTSKDVEVLGFSLVPSGTCTEDTTSADLYMRFRTNRVNTYCVYVVFDIYADNNQLLENDVSIVLGNFNKKVDLDLNIYTINWPCGQSLYIRNIYIQWSQNFPCTNDCSGGSGSKCARPGNIQVLIPGIEVVKVVNGLCESGTAFPITVTGPGYSSSHNFNCSGGYFISTNMVPGTYTVTETVPPGWTASSSPQTVTVYSGTVSTAVVTNTRDTGSLALTKQVQGQCEYGTIFPVSIAGPGGYHSSYLFSCSGGTHTFTNLPTGDYTITEIIPEGWTASGLPQTVTVSKDTTATATVTNIRDTGSLALTKQVIGQCLSGTTFPVTISGPCDYIATHAFDCSGGTYTFTDLPTGTYTITEVVPEGWTAASLPQMIAVSKDTTATATITNTRNSGHLALTKQVYGYCVPGTQFVVSISGPGSHSDSHTFDCSGGSHTFTDLPTGGYTITETHPAEWEAAFSPETVTVFKDETATAIVINTRDSGSLTVTKQVQGECTSKAFEILISGPGGYSASHIFNCSGGPYTFTSLPPGDYAITETVPVAWMALGLPQTVTVSKGETATATVTNLNTQTECQTAFAGADAEICEGNLVMLEGYAIEATSVSWAITTGLGTLEWPYDGSDYKAAYTPPLSGESEAVLTFTANGICPDVSDDVTIYVVSRPIAIITFIPAQV